MLSSLAINLKERKTQNSSINKSVTYVFVKHFKLKKMKKQLLRIIVLTKILEASVNGRNMFCKQVLCFPSEQSRNSVRYALKLALTGDQLINCTENSMKLMENNGRELTSSQQPSPNIRK